MIRNFKRLGLSLLALFLTLAFFQLGALAEDSATAINPKGSEQKSQESLAQAGIPVDDIEIEPDEITLNVGASYTLQVIIEPSNATNKTLSWTSTNPSVVIVDENGTITAVSPGRADVIAMATDGSREDADCEVNVVGGGSAPGNVLIDDIEIEPDEMTLSVGSTYTLQTIIRPANATNKTLTWTSTNPAVATVDSNGTITAVGAGRANIIASATDGSREDADCEVNVVGGSAPGNVLISDIEIEPDDLTLGTGANYTLQVIIEPQNATNKTLSWSSSNPAVATVNESGLVNAVSPGIAYISAAATDGSNERDTCRVIVSSGSGGNILITDIEVEPDDLSLDIGASYTLQTFIEPQNATDKTLSWSSSNPAVATVNESGLVSAVSSGVAYITAAATDGSNERDSCRVTVTSGGSTPGNILITDIDLEPDEMTLNVGATYTLQAIIQPQNATNKTLSWSSSNAAIATVNEAGLVSAVSPGTAVITAAATDGSSERDSCRVTVTSGGSAPGNILITDIDLEPDDMTLDVGASYTLQVIIEPQNATNKTLSWSSSNPSVATVNEAGLVNAVSAGTAVITAAATDGSNERDNCRVIVGSGGSVPGQIPVDDVEVEPDSLNLNVGQSYTLKGYVEPRNASNQNISWSSSNGAVASVDANGNVKAISAGVANIIATSAEGGFSDYCIVTVQGTASPEPQGPFSLSATNPGEFTVTVSGQPESTQAVTVFAWSTPDQSDLRSIKGELDGNVWRCVVPVNPNKNPIVDADDITIHVYVSNDRGSTGTLLGGRHYSWMEASSVAGHYVAYTAHVQNIGFVPTVYDGEMAGTTGQALRLEGVRVSSAISGVGVSAQAHVQDIGWMDPVGDGVYAGTTGQAKRLESVILTLYGPNSADYQLRYRVHQQNIGWSDWVTQGQQAGVTGEALQLEAIEIQLVK